MYIDLYTVIWSRQYPHPRTQHVLPLIKLLPILLPLSSMRLLVFNGNATNRETRHVSTTLRRVRTSYVEMETRRTKEMMKGGPGGSRAFVPISSEIGYRARGAFSGLEHRSGGEAGRFQVSTGVLTPLRSATSPSAGIDSDIRTLVCKPPFPSFRRGNAGLPLEFARGLMQNRRGLNKTVGEGEMNDKKLVTVFGRVTAVEIKYCVQ